MLVGYVSDERYVVLHDVQLEFIDAAGRSVEARSRATGAVYADLAPGRYTVVLARDGYGFKRVQIELPRDAPYQFRMLKDGLLGYAWPKCVQSGEKSEFRVHSDEAYHLALWRYGWHKELVQPIG